MTGGDISRKGTKAQREVQSETGSLAGCLFFVSLCLRVSLPITSPELPMTDELEQIAKDVVDASVKLHMALGQGLLESVYAVLLEHKLKARGYQVERETPVRSSSRESASRWASAPTWSSTAASLSN